MRSTNPVADALCKSKVDPDAFEDFYERHMSALVVFMARRVYDIDTALDLAAESLAQAFLGRRTFRGKTDEQAAHWLYGIASRQVAMFFRRSAVERRGLEKLGLDPPRLSGEEEHARIIELAGLDDLRGNVRLEMRRLSNDQRQALELRVVEELPYEEVADRLGISQQAARARVARGLKKLANALDHYKGPLKEGLT